MAELEAVVARMEQIARQAHALALELQTEVDSRGLHLTDGHASAKVLVRHAGQLSSQEASRRAKAVQKYWQTALIINA
mgnify:CR=1 FL=1